MNITILGGGKMGRAAAYYFLNNTDSYVNIIDIDNFIIGNLKEWIISIQHKWLNSRLSVIKADSLYYTFNKLPTPDCIISCVPYKFNYDLTKLAIKLKSNFIDLGGNNDIVKKQFSLNKDAKKQKVAIVPDCGLAPGLVSLLTKKFYEELEEIDEVKLRVGGLPINPEPPLDYSLFFSVSGLINEYVEPAIAIKNNKIIEIDPLDGLEDIEIDGHEFEAFSTSGGTSTLPETYKEHIKNLDYKTIRYKGHYNKIKLLYDLGFMYGKPREVLEKSLINKLPKPGPDIVYVKAWAVGSNNNKRKRICYEIIEKHDTNTNLSAMMKMTAFTAGAVAEYLNENKPYGVLKQEESISSEYVLNKLNSYTTAKIVKSETIL